MRLVMSTGLSRKLSAPTSKVESAAKHLIKCLMDTQTKHSNNTMTWRSDQSIDVHAYCDPKSGVICQLWNASILHNA
eukprot:315586-Amphidinium_carterae.1